MQNTRPIFFYFLSIKMKSNLIGPFPGSVQATVQPDQQGEDVGPGDTGEGPGRETCNYHQILVC